MNDSGLGTDQQSTDPTLIFGAASFMNDMGSDMIAPVWPTFLRNYLGLNLFQIGIIDGMAITITSLTKVVAGYASDRTGKRKRFITSGYLLSLIGRFMFIFSVSFWQILFYKAMDRIGKMRGPPRDALVAQHSGEMKRGRAFGLLRALDSAGAVVGASISFVIFYYLGYFWTFILAVIPAAVSVVIIVIFVKEQRGKNVFKGISFRGLNRDLKIFLIASIVLAIGTYSYSFLILFSADFGYSDVQLPLLYILFTSVYAVSAYPFGRASDRIGRKVVLVTAFVLFGLTSLWTHLVFDWLSAVPLMIFFGLSNGALDPVQTSFVSDLVEDDRRASIIGAFQMSIGLSALPAGMLLGWTWDNISHIAAFNISLVFCLAATTLLLFVPSRHE